MTSNNSGMVISTRAPQWWPWLFTARAPLQQSEDGSHKASPKEVLERAAQIIFVSRTNWGTPLDSASPL